MSYQLDLAAFCTTKFGTRAQYGPDDFTERQCSEFLETQVGHVLDLSRREQWTSLYESDSLETITKVLSNPNQHRVAIISKNKSHLIGIISQFRF